MTQCACKSSYFRNYNLFSKYFHSHIKGDGPDPRRKFYIRYYYRSNVIPGCKDKYLNSYIDVNTCNKLLNVHSEVLTAHNGIANRRFYSTTPELSNVEITNEYENNWMSNRSDVNDYTLRTHSCGELRSSDIGKKVRLYGWAEYIRMNKFILLRDSYGTTQIIVPKTDSSKFSKLHIESVICVTGIVRPRPPAQIVKHLATGEIEVNATSVEIINHAIPNLPFHVRERYKAHSQVLNRYRFLALRFPEFQDILRLRSKMLFRMREYLITKKEFVEVETPTLFKKTPGGAQEFIVPTQEKNRFYSLVQSPQQLKQLLMVGSIDRYFQIARCYRDETTTGERQPEFTQLDLELSFTDINGVIKLTEDVLAASWPNNKTPITVPFPRMRYKDAIENYGSDKPCLLDKFLIQNLKAYIPEESNDHVYFFTIPNGLALCEKLKEHFEFLFQEANVKIHVIGVPTIEKLCNDLAEIILGFNVTEFQNTVSIKNGDLILLTKGSRKSKSLNILGRCRHHVIDELKLIEEMNAKGIYDFLWVVDFPLFEEKDDGEIKSAHHPFTHPHAEDVDFISRDPLKVRALAYDLVLNGSEIGGGSIRIHNAKLQEEILNILRLPKEDFSHLLDALQMGCPSHGGIALGIDRLIAILCNRKTIKDVIAFPKGQEGQDFMTNCPSDIPLADKIRYHIRLSND